MPLARMVIFIWAWTTGLNCLLLCDNAVDWAWVPPLPFWDLCFQEEFFSLRAIPFSVNMRECPVIWVLMAWLLVFYIPTSLSPDPTYQLWPVHDQLHTGYENWAIGHDCNWNWTLTWKTVTDGPVITISGSVQLQLFFGYHNLTCKH